ncbi:Protein translocase subunit SecY [Candidatus Bealeia paramacronuclearis]|uniref:Protein translocase subunit SecY n=1 Tax=Candidatus Bealeia paramacronuclearis TaxID=1921001 RepID=A0ABZ2C596_9PROT|nr:Protein translocase subunit SecY [Candidatus Bealeia paramacronuclearis]
MASAAEQLAANINFKAFGKAEDLKKRIWFTLGVLIVYRLGTYIPLPGVNPAILAEFARQHSGGIFGMIDMFSGGALGRMTIMALNVVPYISASIIIQLMTSISPQLEAIKKEGESGRRKLNQYTRYLTIVLATVQAYGVAVGLESMSGQAGAAVVDPGYFFRFSVVVTIVGATMFLVWLGEQITSRGIGNGMSMIIFSGIVANLPSSIINTLELGRTGALSIIIILAIILMSVGLIAFIVFMERAQRRLIIQYPKRQVGNKMYGGETSHLPIKLNSTGVIPPIFASSLLMMPTMVISMVSADGPEWLTWLSTHLQHGNWFFMTIYISLILFFAFFYTSVVFNPQETAENLKKHGGFIAGYRPGKNTAEYLDYVVTRLTVIGAAYLAFVCLLPEILMSYYSIPFYLGGTTFLIAVSVPMDTVAQIHSHLLAHQYEGLMKKTRLKGARK